MYILLTRLLILIFVLNAHFSLSQRLSTKAEISILTFGPGDSELYSAFGHSAIRVNDPINRFDAAYNYGVFDFDQPNFYINFTRGHLIYKLAVQDAQGLIAYYKQNNRSITEQVLNMTPSQKQVVFDFLQNNAKPENAGYNYDYFYDNCATKIGDVFIEALAEEFRFDENFVVNPGQTIRELTDSYSANEFPWGKLGIDICLGMPMDKKLTNMQYTYLPDYVFKAFVMAEVRTKEAWNPIVIDTKIIFEASDTTSVGPMITPNLLFWASWILVAIFSFIAKKKNVSLRWFDFSLFFIAGFLGLLLLLLWLVTDHQAAANNLNILWAIPSHFIISFFLLKGSKPRWLNRYLLITIIFGLLLILLWPFLPQALNYALIPVVLIICTRSLGAIME